MSFRFRANPRFSDDVLASLEWRRFAYKKAQEAARIGRIHASSGFMGPKSDLQAEATPTGAAVVHASSGWHLEEFGTRTTGPRAPLRKGVEGAGLKFTGYRR